MSDWHNKRVLCTGASGFVGTRLVQALKERGAYVISIGYEDMFDLRSPNHARAALHTFTPFDILYHLAANVGGIEHNRTHPADILYDNLLIDASVIRVAVQAHISHVIAVGSVCAYPQHANIPLQESDYFDGEPEPTNASYAYSKRMLLAHLQAAHAQYGLQYSYPILANLYGPGQDDNPERSHVIPALIRKFLSSEPVVVWGTGAAKRDFLYVDDAVEALILAGEHAPTNCAVNVGSRVTVTIRALVEHIGRQTNGVGRVVEWDATKPDGQAERLLDISRAEKLWHWQPHISLAEGLLNTIQAYKQYA